MSTYPVQTILELSCSAYRKLGRYVKENEVWLNQLNPKETPNNLPNKWLILSTLRLMDWPDRLPPKDLVVTERDRQFADQIRQYFKRLAFTVMAEDNSFDTTVNSLLNTEFMDKSNIGFIAYVPAMYHKEVQNNRLRKAVNQCENEHLGALGQEFFDLDAEIVDVTRSKNFDAWNVNAIIDNKMCSWLSKFELHLGPAVIIKARVKDFSTHWKYQTPVTRLNYVRAAQ